MCGGIAARPEAPLAPKLPGNADGLAASALHNALFRDEVQRLWCCCRRVPDDGFTGADQQDDVLSHLAQQAKAWPLVRLGRQHSGIADVYS